MKPILNFIFSVCVFAAVSSVVFAEEGSFGQSHHRMGKAHHEMGFDKIFFFQAHCILKSAEKIGLSDEQAQKIKDLTYNLKKSAIKQESDIQLIALDIREEIGKEEINVKTINDLIDKKYAAESQKSKEGIQAYADLKNIVTKEQFKKLKELKAEAMKHWMGHEKKGEWNKEHKTHEEGRQQEKE